MDDIAFQLYVDFYVLFKYDQKISKYFVEVDDSERELKANGLW